MVSGVVLDRLRAVDGPQPRGLVGAGCDQVVGIGRENGVPHAPAQRNTYTKK